MVLLLFVACTDYKLNENVDANDGDQPDIAVEPDTVDFGSVPVGCLTTQDVRVSNVGLAPLEIDAMTWTGSGEIVGDTPTLSLLPGESSILTVRYAPTAAGHASAELSIHSNDPDEENLPVPHDGAGVSSATTDRYVQRTPTVDVLWVVDNSGSMGEEQARVIADIESFYSYFTTLGLDYHMGVITTDILTPSMAGRLQGVPTYITPDTANGETELAEALAVGTEDQGDESGLAALRLALSEPLLSAENAGFLREDAQLVVAILTDEPEQSGYPSSDYIAFLGELKPDPTFINVSAIVGDYDAGCSTTCDGAASTAQPGNAYIDVANAYPGVFGSICTCGLGPILDEIGLDGTLFTREFALTRTPAYPDLIEVSVDGLVVTSGWMYDATENAVIFDIPPDAGQLVDLTYDVLPDCG